MNGKELRDLATRLEISTAITHPDIVAANRALNVHENECPTCDRIRQWIAEEFASGRVQTIADRDRIGVYITQHACAEGLLLFIEVGKVMMVRPDQSHR